MSAISIMMRIISLVCMSAMLSLASCADGPEDVYMVPQPTIPDEETDRLQATEVYQLHKDAKLKILAIGNSFTHNAASFMPWFVELLNDDAVCVAKLTRSGCSLGMHWRSHLANSPDYEFYYSSGGCWHEDDIPTIDEALALFDWDIIVLQQASGDSGIFSTYQPYLDNMVELLRSTNPGARLAWHYTWPYREDTDHPYFSYYDNDPLKMYEAILDACDKASVGFDIKIPSATLIWEMRKCYPEVEDGFSADGYHISDPLALYALSTLWYELLVQPVMLVSCLNPPVYPQGIDPASFERALSIIKSLLDSQDSDDSASVPQIYC